MGEILPSFLRLDVDDDNAYVGLLFDHNTSRTTRDSLIERLTRALGGTLESPPLSRDQIDEQAAYAGTDFSRGLVPLHEIDFIHPGLYPLDGCTSPSLDDLSFAELARRAYLGGLNRRPDPLWLREAIRLRGSKTRLCVELIEDVLDVARRAHAIDSACNMEASA